MSKTSNALTLEKSELLPIKLPNIAQKFRISCYCLFYNPTCSCASNSAAGKTLIIMSK